MSNNKIKPTRGDGLLENFLAKLRTNKANSLINEVSRGKILDIGCGTYPYFLLNTNFKEKYGIDPSINIDLIKNKNIKVIKLDVTLNRLPFRDNYFDAITMLAVFEHLDTEKIGFVLKEARRVLKNNGVFIITTPSPWSDKLLHLMARLSLISAEEMHEHKSNYTMKKIVDIIKWSGFSNAKIKSGYFEFIFNMWFKIVK